MTILIYGLITGIIFGILLQKGRVIRYDVQMGALRLKDMTIIKFMFSSVLVAMVGVYLLVDLGQASLRFQPTILGQDILGGLVFGAGWGLIGYCPGTSAGAIGEGRWDALLGAIGMFVGAAIFAEVYPIIMNTRVMACGNYGSITLPDVLGVNHWFVIIAFVIGGLSLFRWLEKKGL